jgi:hypothetical protein
VTLARCMTLRVSRRVGAGSFKTGDPAREPQGLTRIGFGIALRWTR